MYPSIVVDDLRRIPEAMVIDWNKAQDCLEEAEEIAPGLLTKADRERPKPLEIPRYRFRSPQSRAPGPPGSPAQTFHRLDSAAHRRVASPAPV